MEHSGWQGQVQLTYTRKRNKTHVANCHAQAPLKVQRPFYPEGPEVCHTVLLHTAGGIVGGDRLDLDLTLQPQAQVLLTTAAASKIYRSSGPEARQTIHIKLAPGAILEWLPQEAILFEQAAYRQDLRVELEPESSWLGWEITRFGRTARQEQFLKGNWRSHTEVWQNQRPLWIDRQKFAGSEEAFHSPHGLAGCAVVGSFAWLGQTVNPELVDQVRGLWQGDSQRSIVGVTRLQQGLLCRYRGPSTLEARHWFMAVWQLIRLSCWGQSVSPPRVWPI